MSDAWLHFLDQNVNTVATKTFTAHPYLGQGGCQNQSYTGSVPFVETRMNARVAVWDVHMCVFSAAILTTTGIDRPLISAPHSLPATGPVSTLPALHSVPLPLPLWTSFNPYCLCMRL